MKQKTRWHDALVLAAVLCAAFLIVTGTQQITGRIDGVASMVFVLAVFLISIYTDGYVWGVVASLIGVLAVNFAFRSPYFAFNFTLPENLFSGMAMLVVSIMTSTLTTRIKKQEQLRMESETEKMRATLLRAVSHDLRTPLTSIYGACSTVIENYDSLEKEQKLKLLGEACSDAQWLNRMVENLLSITRINGDRAQLQTTWEVVEEVVGGAVGKFQKQFPQIEVETSMPEEVVMAPMDGILVEQVLVNLMENSAIHGETTTKIRISVQKLQERVLFCVEDNGKGIDPAILPIIFEGQLPTGDHAASDGKRSMGIGLSVCMSIIQAHQGDMKAENMAAHRGARIQFWLPCQEENWMEEA